MQMINLRRHWYGDNYEETLPPKEYGITFKHAVGQTMGDQTWYFDCSNIPDSLPEGYSILKGELEKFIGWGLSEDDVKTLKTKLCKD